MLYMILFDYYNKQAKAYLVKYSLPLSILLSCRLLKIPSFCCSSSLLFGTELVDLEIEQKDDVNRIYIFSCMSKLHFLVKKNIYFQALKQSQSK